MAHVRFDSSASTVTEAQQDMRTAYYAGAPGMLTSGLVWLIAAAVAMHLDVGRAIWTLFIGGMLIHPVSLVLCKLLGRSGKHTAGNPLGSLAMATTFWMILSLPLAYAASLVRIEWFFPAMLFVIGGRYLTFATIYGMRVYWICGAALAFAGWLLARASVAPELAAVAGSAIEAGFACAIFFIARRESVDSSLPRSAPC